MLLDVAIMPMEMEELIFLDGEPVKFDCSLFNNDQDACSENSHIKAYNKMQDLIRMTANDEDLNLFVTMLNGCGLGAISGFINFIPNKTRDKSTFSNRTLTVWLMCIGERSSQPYAFFQHAYTYDDLSGIYYGRTISRIELVMETEGLPEKGIQ